MPYQIEVLSINAGLYPLIEKAFTSLNAIQDDFKFYIPSETLRSKLYIQERNNYLSDDVYTWLEEYKIEALGNRPYIILVVDGDLSSVRLGNLFGTSKAESGFAIFTVKDFDQFVNDKVRFIRYYLVRYAIGFIEPRLKAHNDPDRKSCIFHKKMKKIEILESLNSGEICQPCFDQLSPRLNKDIHESIQKMLLIVSNQHPYALVIKGGGIKGIAFAGALLELEKHFSFNTFAGTSVGAIVAVLLGAGYKPEELHSILSSKDFNDFKDSSFLGIIINLIKTRALYPGNEIENWLRNLISDKFPDKLNDVKLCDYVFHTIVYASRINDGTLTFDSKNENKDFPASFAARCSMSIPYFFSPKSVAGYRVYDGGLRNNFPIKIFMETYPQKPVIGLFLLPSSKKGGSVIGELSNIAIEGEEASIVEKNMDKVVLIDPRPIKTTDFNLTKTKEEFLILSGRLGALKFIARNYPDIEIDKGQIPTIQDRIKELKKKIK